MLTPQQKADKVETLLGDLAKEVYIHVEDGGFWGKDGKEYGAVSVCMKYPTDKVYKKAWVVMKKVFGKDNVYEEYDINEVIVTCSTIKLKK